MLVPIYKCCLNIMETEVSHSPSSVNIIRYSPVVTHPSTDHAQDYVTLIGDQEVVLSTLHSHWLLYLPNILHSVTSLIFNVGIAYPISLTTNKK